MTNAINATRGFFGWFIKGNYFQHQLTNSSNLSKKVTNINKISIKKKKFKIFFFFDGDIFHSLY